MCANSAASTGVANITCVIRDESDPNKGPGFEEYARNWGQAIPRCGADLLGYFAPHEGSATTAPSICTVENLAAYEGYRACLKEDPIGRENFALARRECFIRREDRLFLCLASGPHAPLIRP